jgi:hypothetical protein
LPRVILVVRELNRQKPGFSLSFDLPEIPRVGNYISIYRPDSQTHTEDVVVRHVWWQLDHPDLRASHAAGDEKHGAVRDILVECDVALGPYARDDWRMWAESAKARGAEVVKFEVERFSVSEAGLRK